MAVDLERLPAGRQLAVRRLVLGVTQAVVAERLGLPSERISEAERESPYRSARALQLLQGQIDGVLQELERERQTPAEVS